jgi:hypothetical protein
MPPRHKNPECPFSERYEKSLEPGAICLGKDGETGDGTPLASVIRWRDSPYAAAPASQLSFFVQRIFFQAVGWVGDDCMNVIRWAKIHPL